MKKRWLLLFGFLILIFITIVFFTNNLINVYLSSVEQFPESHIPGTLLTVLTVEAIITLVAEFDLLHSYFVLFIRRKNEKWKVVFNKIIAIISFLMFFFAMNSYFGLIVMPVMLLGTIVVYLLMRSTYFVIIIINLLKNLSLKIKKQRIRKVLKNDVKN